MLKLCMQLNMIYCVNIIVKKFNRKLLGFMCAARRSFSNLTAYFPSGFDANLITHRERLEMHRFETNAALKMSLLKDIATK